MKGSIQKKGKVYYAVIPFNGKRKWFRGGTRKDAERVLAERLTEINQGTYTEIPKLTFKAYTEIWFKSYAEMNLKPSTLALYRVIIDKHFIPQWGDCKPDLIKSVQMQLYFSDRLKKVGHETVRNEVALLKQMFKHAHQWGYVKVNPAEHLQRPKMVRPEIEILEPAEFKKLLEHSGGLYRVAFLTAILTGIRAGELWGLQWCDMDWNSKQLYVHRSVWKNGFQTPKSKNSIRKIDLPDNLVLELKKWKLACPISEHDLMFPSKEGQITCHDNTIKRHYEPALREAGLRHVSFHSLRHTNASLRIRAEQNVKYMSMQMGHSSINITLDTYGHLFNDEDFNRQQVDLLQETFHSVRNPLENPLQNAEKGLAVSLTP
jgi:integrase